MNKFEYAARLLNDGVTVTIWSVSFQGYAQDVPVEQFPRWYADFMKDHPAAVIHGRDLDFLWPKDLRSA